MSDLLRYAILGLGLGALYTLVAQGLVVVYRGSGVLNFAHAAMGVAAAYVSFDLQDRYGWSYWPAFVAAVAFGAMLGALTYLLVIRPLRHASSLARLIGSLAVLIVLQAAVLLRYDAFPRVPTSALPQSLWHLGTIVVPVERLVIALIAVVLTVVLWAIYRFTPFGVHTAAVAENPRAAAALGISPATIALANWTLGAALAAAACILISPVTSLQLELMTSLVVAGIATALIAGFSSFPITLAAGMVIGVLESEASNLIHQPGLPRSIPLLVLIVALSVRGTSLPVRGHVLDRLPALGTGRINPRVVIPAVVLAFLAVQLLPVDWVDATTSTLTVAIVLLSLVVVTGFAGQLSLAQFALAGTGAFIAGRIVATTGIPFEVAFLLAVVGAIPIGALVALPAVRTRGVNLAVVTLGIAFTAESMVFGNSKYTGGFTGTTIGKPSFFGIDINAGEHPERYASFCLFFFVLMALAVANLRRGRSGRRMIAIRGNERAAASLGIDVPRVKILSFAISAGIAAVGGVLIAFRSTSILYPDFSTFQSILFVALATIGGIGYVIGALAGAILAPGGFGAVLGHSLFKSIDTYLPLISGAALVLMLVRDQNGMAHGWRHAAEAVRARRRTRRGRGTPVVLELIDATEARRVEPLLLEIEDLTVRFGGLVAVDAVSLRVEPGQILGLIGPNGAGKTTVVDAVTGFNHPSAGTIELGGRRIERFTASARAQASISRSFQSLELFEDMTVYENIQTASDRKDLFAFVTDLVWPGKSPLPPQAIAAIREFGLEDHLQTYPTDLPYGTRRLVGIARAVASAPSVLLLDEPAAGLSERESRELSALVRRLADEWGMSVLVIEHDMHFVMDICDRVAVLDFGRKIADGTPEEVRNDPIVRSAYLGEAEEDEPSIGVVETTS